jgi:phenylacetate-CoA ligase
LGYQRISAYDLRPEALRRAGDALERNPPEYVIGYSVALDLFAQVNADRAPSFRSLGVKAVIATAESFPSPESPGRLADLFGCPVGMEYGAVETGLLAHTHPNGGFRIFWESYLVDAAPSDHGHQLFVTSLYPRCFPLLRYAIGDNTRLPSDRTGPEAGIRRLAEVLGRCNDDVLLPDGQRLHSELFTHALRQCPEVLAYQVVLGADRVFIRYVAANGLKAATAADIRDRLARIHPALANIGLERVPQLHQTVAGKTRMVVRE